MKRTHSIPDNLRSRYKYLHDKSKSEIIDIISARVSQLRSRRGQKKISINKIRFTIRKLVDTKGVDKTIDLFQSPKIQASFKFQKQLDIYDCA